VYPFLYNSNCSQNWNLFST